MNSTNDHAGCLMAVLLLATLCAIGTDANAAPRPHKPATTAESATHNRPSVSRSQYVDRAPANRLAANSAARTNRRSAGRSALGDARTADDGRRTATSFAASPVATWSGWIAASQAAKPADEQRTLRQRVSRNGRRVTFYIPPVPRQDTSEE